MRRNSLQKKLLAGLKAFASFYNVLATVHDILEEDVDRLGIECAIFLSAFLGKATYHHDTARISIVNLDQGEWISRNKDDAPSLNSSQSKIALTGQEYVTNISFNLEQIRYLRSIGEQLACRLVIEFPGHFYLTNIQEDKMAAIGGFDRALDDFLDHHKNSEDIPSEAYSILDDIIRNTNSLVKARSSFGNTQGSDIIISSKRVRHFQIAPITEFGKLLLSCAETATTPYPTASVVPDITFDSWTSISQVVRSLLVHYYFEFGNYNRLKLCLHCGSLYVEHNKGRKLYCSDTCRKKYYLKRNDQEKMKCLARQNKYVSNRYNSRKKHSNIKTTPYLLTKDNCLTCCDVKPGGECIMIRNQNPSYFQ